jgi:phosphoserine phosphatase
MIRLYLTRHGQTEWNLQKKMQGWEDSPLTQEGISDSTKLGEKLRGVPIDQIYSSDAFRALNTAEIIRGNRKIQVTPVKALREINLGIWEGKTFKEIKTESPDLFEAFWNNPESFIPDGGESFDQVQTRAINFINQKIISEHPEGNFLVVCHTVVIKVILAYYEPRSLSDIWNSPYIHPTSLSLIEFNDGVPKIRFSGDTAHLGE